MINIDKTKNVLKIDVTELKPNSEKMVFWNCDTCHTEKQKKFRMAKLNKNCRNCSNKAIAKNDVSRKKRSDGMKEKYRTGYTHPLQGKKRSQSTIDKMRKSRIGLKCSDELKKHFSEKYSGSGNPFYGKRHSEENIKKMSEIQKRTAKRGKDCNFYGKRFYAKKKSLFYRDIFFRSSWELKYAMYLDQNSIAWIYEPEAFDLIVENKECTYTPDFYLPESQQYIEIKGFWYGDARVKLDAFMKIKPNTLIIVEKDLKKLSLKNPDGISVGFFQFKI